MNHEIEVLGRTLDPRPSNVSVGGLAQVWQQTGKIMVDVEPGDLTRYVFILVKPHVKVPTMHPDSWFIVPLSGLKTEAGTWELGFVPEGVGPWDFPFTNEHSRHFMAAWIRWFTTILYDRST